MTRRRQHSSLGDMVSTAAFLGMSIYLLLAGFEFKADGRLISAIGVWLVMCSDLSSAVLLISPVLI